MAKYPTSTSVAYTNPVSIGMRFKTLVSNFDDMGEEKRKQKWAYPKRDITMQYEAISKSEAEDLWRFYQLQGGRYNAFVWFESTGAGATGYNSYAGEYVGTGDSTTLVFNLPAVDSSQVNTFYIAGGAVSTSDYTFSAGGGADNEDKITLISSSAGGIVGRPTSTDRMTYDFIGRLKVRCRFAEDIVSYENFLDRLINMGVKLTGLLNS